MKFYDKPGRGLKLCLCGKYIGVRNKQCECGNSNFEINIKPKKSYPKLPKEVIVEDKSYIMDYFRTIGTFSKKLVLTPSGNPPSKPRSLDQDHIDEWIWNIISDNDGILYITAIKYRARQIYLNDDELKIALSRIDNWYQTCKDQNCLMKS